MPASFWIARDANTVLLVLRGDVDLNERTSAIRDIIKGETFVSGMDILEDRRELKTIESTASIQEWLSTLADYGHALNGTRWAIVASSPAAYGMANVTSVLAEEHGLSIRGFNNMGEACTWLRR